MEGFMNLSILYLASLMERKRYAKSTKVLNREISKLPLHPHKTYLLVKYKRKERWVFHLITHLTIYSVFFLCYAAHRQLIMFESWKNKDCLDDKWGSKWSWDRNKDSRGKYFVSFLICILRLYKWPATYFKIDILPLSLTLYILHDIPWDNLE